MADPLYCPWILGAPCMKPEVWAAWWQAILSAAAIFAAVRLATGQERRNLSRKADVYVSLLDNSEQTVSKVIAVGVRSFSEFKSICTVAQQKLEQMAKALDLVTLQELPDYRLLPIIHDAARTLQYLAKDLERLSTVVEEPASPNYLSVLHSGQGALVRYFNDAADVANEYSSPTIRQRWNKLRVRFLRDSNNEID